MFVQMSLATAVLDVASLFTTLLFCCMEVICCLVVLRLQHMAPNPPSSPRKAKDTAWPALRCHGQRLIYCRRLLYTCVDYICADAGGAVMDLWYSANFSTAVPFSPINLSDAIYSF